MIDLRFKNLPKVEPDNEIQEWEKGRCSKCNYGSSMGATQVMCAKYNQICAPNQKCKSYQERK